MLFLEKLNLQLFAGEGASGAGGEGGAEGAETGVTGADAGHQRLRELGVPEHKLRNRARGKSTAAGVATPVQRQETAPQEQAAAAEAKTEEPKKDDGPKKPSFDELMKDPEYNKRMQETIQARLKGSKQAQETLDKLIPALDVLAGKYNLDRDNLDYEALAKAISEDNGFYEDRAVEMGVTPDTARRMDLFEREQRRAHQAQERTMQQQAAMQHLQNLHQQGEKLKEQFPGFDLQRELQNPVFSRMTSPSGGVSVEDAYFAVHRAEIQEAGMRAATEMAAKKMSAAIQAGARRPAENGTSSQAPSATHFNYRNASPEQREALKQEIRRAAARGEKVYPKH